MTKGESCEGCAFWRKTTETTETKMGRGECHARAPRPVISDDRMALAYAAWPFTDADDSCGEMELPSELPEVSELGQVGAHELAELMIGAAEELRSRTAELAGGVLEPEKLTEVGRFVWGGSSSLVMFRDGDELRAGAAAEGLGILELEL